MNLKDIVEALNSIALKQPAINEIIKSGNVYDLNENRNANFSVFCAVQRTHNYDLSNGRNTYNFFLYYIDRLQSDESNKIDIQSTGIEVLKNICRTFSLEYEDDCEINNVDFEVFSQSFAQLCAGAYATISINCFDENCVDIF